MSRYSLSLLSHASAVGVDNQTVCERLFSLNSPSPLERREIYPHCGATFVGMIKEPLPVVPDRLNHFSSRIASISMLLASRADRELTKLREKYAPHRIGIVLGLSTSGIGEAEEAFIIQKQTGVLPSSYYYRQQEMGAVARFMAQYLELTGPAYTISTACSSSAKAFQSARSLLSSGVCDAVITGGVDSLCKLTVGGFSSLELLSPELNNPFSVNRKGLNIGEGGAIFLLTKDENTPFRLLGVGESADAYHVSTPHPDGLGAAVAISAAMADANITPSGVSYLNLHGTGTVLNDSMESKAVSSALGNEVPCSSTKPLTGHALGAAGALEIAFCCLALEHGKAPLHRFDGERDSALPPIALATEPMVLDKGKAILSSSFAFGGSNCCVAIGAQ